MGSGSGGNHAGTGGASQPYAENYHVVSSEMNKDKKDPDIYSKDKGYFKNPTATKLNDAVSGDGIYLEDKRAVGNYTYVLDNKGNIVFGRRANPNDGRKRAPHPTLIGGKDPTVQCAGMIEFRKGRIVSVNNSSGHYRPDKKSMEKVEKALQKLYKKHPEVFDKNPNGGNSHDR